ncbi:hypothetical protein MNV49_002956 [Pseudohyphozyma bogoriensis]|nr:hypothetical protein MNV49_002956 [Pseudohyphozyma bogoriensis]
MESKEQRGGPRFSRSGQREGSWKMRDGGVWKTREELNAGFGIRQGTTAYDRCIPPGEDGSLTSAHLNRLLTAASYEWHPDSGCYLIPLARVDFITRLLQSYHGLWLIGDSLTGEHFDYLDNFLSWPGGPVSQTQVNDRRMLMFNANHPEAEFYLRRAGVPAERLARPLVWVARHDRLLNIEELGKIWEYVGVPGFSWLRPQDEAEWFGSLAATSKEQAKLAEADNPYKPTLAMVSTGAHWTRYSMNITTDEEMYLGMAEAAKRILGAISTVEHVDFFVRTQSPGHPGCEAAHEPTPIPSNDFATVAKFGKDLGWQMFSTYNKIWKDQIAERQQSLGWTRFGVVDNWNLENQRPDLHLRPPTDCLHHCMPSLQHHWTRGLWHEIKIRDLAREA